MPQQEQRGLQFMELDKYYIFNLKHRLCIALVICIIGLPAAAGILWTGGEDLDFPNGVMACASTNVGHFRVGYARQAIAPCVAGYMKSTAFRGGPVTSAWLSVRFYGNAGWGGKIIGIGKSGTNSALLLGGSVGSANKLALFKMQSGVVTEIATESGLSLVSTTRQKYDIQIVNYGGSGTIKVYISGLPTQSFVAPILTYTGDISLAGVSDLDTVFSSDGISNFISEVIVADTDTRNLSLVSLTPSADGDLNQWTGGNYVNVSGTTQSDVTPITNNTNDEKFQCHVTNLPSTGLTVLNVKVGVRGTSSPGGATSVAVGVKTNATVSVPSPSTTMSPIWGLVETYYDQNPVTAQPWVNSDVDALQINMTTKP